MKFPSRRLREEEDVFVKELLNLIKRVVMIFRVSRPCLLLFSSYKVSSLDNRKGCQGRSIHLGNTICCLYTTYELLRCQFLHEHLILTYFDNSGSSFDIKDCKQTLEMKKSLCMSG